MLDNVIVYASRVIEVAFFAGLIGCVFVIVKAWVTILRDVSTEDTPDDI